MRVDKSMPAVYSSVKYDAGWGYGDGDVRFSLTEGEGDDDGRLLLMGGPRELERRPWRFLQSFSQKQQLSYYRYQTAQQSVALSPFPSYLEPPWFAEPHRPLQLLFYLIGCASQGFAERIWQQLSFLQLVGLQAHSLKHDKLRLHQLSEQDPHSGIDHLEPKLLITLLAVIEFVDPRGTGIMVRWLI